ncbi:uncharacterized protein LOC119556055 [Drosophila subpulchrella]|uniref:uncharacterized protein LOC119556055 n=1 Tax=Drosophila subpulchrella TaxID=1486046 RepID=UPI0018A15D46|nr:uncharacterized protein LOC119556055 [Drosophila subpulchrella]XP_037723788.1 uncharacterized protein LOC119556055 [Drosophila subpulchrella]
MNSSETMDEKAKIIALFEAIERSLTPENRHVTRTRKVVKKTARPSLADKNKHGIAHVKGSSLPKRKCLRNKGKHDPQQAEDVRANTPWFQEAQTQKAVPPTEDAKTLQGVLNQPAVPQTQQSWSQGVQGVPQTQDSVPQPQHSWFQGDHNQPDGSRTLDSWFQKAQTQEAVPQAQVPWFQGAQAQNAVPQTEDVCLQGALIQPQTQQSWFQQAQTQEAVPQAQVPWFQGANSQGTTSAPQNSFFQVAQNQPEGPGSVDSWFQKAQTQEAVPQTQESVPQPQHSWFQGAHSQGAAPAPQNSFFQGIGPRSLHSWSQGFPKP